MNIDEKIMAKYMKKVKTMRHILSVSADPFLRLTSQKQWYMFQISFGDRNVIISDISNAPNLHIYIKIY